MMTSILFHPFCNKYCKINKLVRKHGHWARELSAIKSVEKNVEKRYDNCLLLVFFSCKNVVKTQCMDQAVELLIQWQAKESVEVTEAILALLEAAATWDK